MMLRKVTVSFLAFLLVGACVIGVGMLADPTVGLPMNIVSESPCPASGCASGECHGYGDVPNPDGVHELKCPEASCSDVECHAWDSLIGRYHQASDASLNLWILAPVTLVIGLVLLVKVLSKGGEK